MESLGILSDEDTNYSRQAPDYIMRQVWSTTIQQEKSGVTRECSLMDISLECIRVCDADSCSGLHGEENSKYVVRMCPIRSVRIPIADLFQPPVAHEPPNPSLPSRAHFSPRGASFDSSSEQPQSRHHPPSNTSHQIDHLLPVSPHGLLRDSDHPMVSLHLLMFHERTSTGVCSA